MQAIAFVNPQAFWYCD